jgi:hypothetical protein
MRNMWGPEDRRNLVPTFAPQDRIGAAPVFGETLHGNIEANPTHRYMVVVLDYNTVAAALPDRLLHRVVVLRPLQLGAALAFGLRAS